MPKLKKELIQSIKKGYDDNQNYKWNLHERANERGKSFEDYFDNRMININNFINSPKDENDKLKMQGQYVADYITAYYELLNRNEKEFVNKLVDKYAKQIEKLTGISFEQLSKLLDIVPKEKSEVEKIESIDEKGKVESNVELEDSEDYEDDPEINVVKPLDMPEIVYGSPLKIEEPVKEEGPQIVISTLDYFDEFNRTFKIGFNEQRNGDELEKVYDNVLKYGLDGVNSEERLIAYSQALKAVKGEFASIDKIKSGIELMDKAQASYNKHNILARALSHLGLFPSITKEREKIDKMKEVLKFQGINDKDFDGIKNGSITELPQETLNIRDEFKQDLNKAIKDMVVKTKANLEHQLERDKNYTDKAIDYRFVTSNMDDKTLGIINDIKAEYKQMSANMDKKYNKENCAKLSKDKEFIDGLKKAGQYDEYKNELKALANKYSEVHFSGVTKDENNRMVQAKFLKQTLPDYDKKYKEFKEKMNQEQIDYIKNGVNKKFDDLYNKGAIQSDTDLDEYKKYYGNEIEKMLKAEEKFGLNTDIKKSSNAQLQADTNLDKSTTISQSVSKDDPNNNKVIEAHGKE